MVLLQLMEPASLVLTCVDVVQRPVSQVVAYVPNHECSPEKRKEDGVLDWDDLAPDREQETYLNDD